MENPLSPKLGHKVVCTSRGQSHLKIKGQVFTCHQQGLA